MSEEKPIKKFLEKWVLEVTNAEDTPRQVFEGYVLDEEAAELLKDWELAPKPVETRDIRWIVIDLGPYLEDRPITARLIDPLRSTLSLKDVVGYIPPFYANKEYLIYGMVQRLGENPDGVKYSVADWLRDLMAMRTSWWTHDPASPLTSAGQEVNYEIKFRD